MRKFFLLLLALTFVMADCGQPEVMEAPDVLAPPPVEKRQAAPPDPNCAFPWSYECQSSRVWDI